MRAFVLAVLAAACSSTPAAVSPVKPVPQPAPKVVKVEEPEPEPEPLEVEEVAFEQAWAFVTPSLGSFSPRLMPEDELVKRLPVAVRAQYRAVGQARKKHRDAQSALMFEGAVDDAAKQAAFDRAHKAFDRALDTATGALEKLLAKKPTAAVGIALARLRERGTGLSDDTSSRTLRYGSIAPDPDSLSVIEPLETATAASSPGDDLGRWVRLELVHHLMATERARQARPILEDLVRVSRPDQQPQLVFRLGLLQGLEGADVEAAETFRSAHAELAVTSGISRFKLLAAELLARHRAGQFERVLELAREAWVEHESPAQLKPDPDPPPPPPPPKRVAAKGKRKHQSLRAAAEYGMIGLLGSSSLSSLSGLEGSFDEGDVLLLATDAVERLGIEHSALQGPEEFRAGIAARLAARALYRSDDAAAKSFGEQARKLGGGASRDGLRVLRLLALRAGDTEQAEALAKQIQALPWSAAMYPSGVEHSALDDELRIHDESQRGEKSDDKDVKPPVERNVRSLVRLCLEPVHHRLPQEKTIEQRFVVQIALRATVFPGGRVEIESDATPATGDQLALSEVTACAKKLAPRVLAHAPSSVRARVSVKQLSVPSGGLFGTLSSDDLGRGWGTLGSGISGFGSGGGTATGIGGLGLRGTGSGGGGTGSGYGTGAGGLGGLGTKGKAPPKKKKK